MQPVLPRLESDDVAPLFDGLVAAADALGLAGSGNLNLHWLCRRVGQKKKRDHALAFDHLLALSHNILEYSHWAHDHEDSKECCKVVTKLGLAWKGVLAKTDAELGIDAEYTRPGISYLLRNVENLAVGLDEHTAWQWQ